jgi:hypothetical protein
MDFGDYIAEAEEQARLRSHALVKKFGQELLKKFQLPSAGGNGKLTVKGIVMRGGKFVFTGLSFLTFRLFACLRVFRPKR